MVKPQIACYITGGWTECGYMTHFLEKINNTFDYRQRFPQKNIGKKGKARTHFKVDGKTGADLIKWIYDDIRNHKEAFQKYHGILIEDDMDDQFFLPSKTGRDYAEIEARKQKITANIRELLQNQEMPVFFLYALPEIVSWFLADWDHTFAVEHKSVLHEMNLYFAMTFRKYIIKQVLTEKYPVTELEDFGYIHSSYLKLSDLLKDAYQEYSCADEAYKNNRIYNGKINELIKNNRLGYSKKVEGINMLQRLNPENVAAICTHYFSKNYMALKTFQV